MGLLVAMSMLHVLINLSGLFCNHHMISNSLYFSCVLFVRCFQVSSYQIKKSARMWRWICTACPQTPSEKSSGHVWWWTTDSTHITMKNPSSSERFHTLTLAILNSDWSVTHRGVAVNLKVKGTAQLSGDVTLKDQTNYAHNVHFHIINSI